MYIHPQTGANWEINSIDAGVVTDTALWTPDTGKKIIITDIVISVSSATTVTLYFDSDTIGNRVFKGYFAANQGVHIAFSGLVISSINGILKITNTAATASIEVTGVEVT